MDCHADPSALLLAEIERFLVTHEMYATEFGERAVGDPSLVHDLRKGRELRRHTRARVIGFMAAHSSVCDQQGIDAQQKDSTSAPFQGRVLP